LPLLELIISIIPRIGTLPKVQSTISNKTNARDYLGKLPSRIMMKLPKKLLNL